MLMRNNKQFNAVKLEVIYVLSLMGFNQKTKSIPVQAFWTALETVISKLNIQSGEGEMDLDAKEGYVVLFNDVSTNITVTLSVM